MTNHDENDKTVSVKLEHSLVERVGQIANKYKISKQRLFTNILTVGAGSAIDNEIFYQIAFLSHKIKKAVFPKDEKQISVIPIKLTADLLQKIDIISSRWSTSRHDAMKQIITVGVDEVSCFDRLGLIKPILKLKDIEDAFNSVCKKSEEIFNRYEDEEKNLNRLSHDK